MDTRFPFSASTSSSPTSTFTRLAAVLALSLTALSSSLFASPVISVLPGYDLEATKDGTNLLTVPLTGVPLGTYDFGGTVGVKSVGDADTIVQRLGSAGVGSTPGSSSPVNIQLDALQLVTTAPTDFGAGVNFYYVTLQSARGGPVSTGQTTINFTDSTSGTFSSFFDVFFDLRLGSLSGPIVMSSDDVITNSGTPWQRTPPEANDVLINGINSNLDSVDTAGDFWPVGPLTHTGPREGHTVGNAVLPEPATMSLVAVAGLLTFRRRRVVG